MLLTVAPNHHVPCSTAAEVWRELAEMCKDVLATLPVPEAATALPAPRHQSSWVLTVITDRPRRQASGFRWWIRKSGLHQKCSSPAELRCIQLPTWGYSIHHLHNVTVGDKAQSQHKQNLIKSLAKEPVNEAAPTKKAHNCLRIDIMPDTWGQSFCPVMEDFTVAWHAVLESIALASPPGLLSSSCKRLRSVCPEMTQNHSRKICKGY